MKIDVVGNLPQYMSDGAAGADLIATDDYYFQKGSKHLIKTGTKVSIPKGYFGMAVPRSSLCNKNGLRLVNSVGIIDSDYRGEIMFCYINDNDSPVTVPKGERIGQLVILPFVKAEFNSVESLDSTERGEGGFGSTGK